jgi:hypothetical protein
LCTENGIDISAARKLKKKHLIRLLIVSALNALQVNSLTSVGTGAVSKSHCQFLQASMQYCENPRTWF